MRQLRRVLVLTVSGVLLLGACEKDQGDAALKAADADVTTTSTTEAPTTTTAAPSTTTTAPSTTTTTAAPTTTTTRPRPTTTTTAEVAEAATEDCHPSYRGTCIPPDVSDADCAGGSGNGPWYVKEKNVSVVGPDVFDLDRDGDGIGCES